jgi:chemotaxis protein MotB
MSASRRHRHEEHEEHENEERWLVSYADMMTLLFCLFMVLFAISSVNTSKFEALQKALQDAFSGAILSGGKAVMTTGSDQKTDTKTAAQPPLEALRASTTLTDTQTSDAAQNSQSKSAEAERAAKEQASFEALKRRIDQLAKQEHIAKHVRTTITPDGLIIELLTDKIFFDSGSATLKTPAVPLLQKVGAIIAGEHEHPVEVGGFTDAQPIHTDRYSSNWSLSGDRAAAVVEGLHSSGVATQRLSLKGYGSQQPVATNSTPEGRSRNRRVDVVLTRLHRTS